MAIGPGDVVLAKVNAGLAQAQELHTLLRSHCQSAASPDPLPETVALERHRFDYQKRQTNLGDEGMI